MEQLEKDLNLVLDYSTIEKKRNFKVLMSLNLEIGEVENAILVLNLTGELKTNIQLFGGKVYAGNRQSRYSFPFGVLPLIIASFNKNKVLNRKIEKESYLNFIKWKDTE